MCFVFGIIINERGDCLKIKNKLNIKVYKTVDSLSFWAYFLTGISVGIMNAFVPIRLSPFEVLILFVITDSFIAPFFADKIVESRMKSYIKNNYDAMENAGSGEKEFSLHTIHYTVKWGVDNTDNVELSIDNVSDL